MQHPVYKVFQTHSWLIVSACLADFGSFRRVCVFLRGIVTSFIPQVQGTQVIEEGLCCAYLRIPVGYNTICHMLMLSLASKEAILKPLCVDD